MTYPGTGTKNRSATLKKLIPGICAFLLASFLFFPPFKFSAGMPAIEVVDVILPFLIFILVRLRHEINHKRWLLLLVAFGIFILLTMIINHRLGFIADYFEIYKLGKFAIVICLFSFVDPYQFFERWIKPIFALLLIFNLIQYFNVFNINDLFEELYFGNGHYANYGLNSAGVPHSKRMLGLEANPNNNAYVFFIFVILFLPWKQATVKVIAWLSLALVFMFLCQSRTSLLAIPCVLLVYTVLSWDQLKRVLTVATTVVVSFVLAHLITSSTVGIGTPIDYELLNAYLEAYPNDKWDPATQTFLQQSLEVRDQTYLESVIHGQFTQGTSMMGRYEVWQHLWHMIKEKPVFGHGPYKEYFYDNQLYAENEFISMTWRYGFIGLFIYLAILGHIAWMALRNRSLVFAKIFLLMFTLFCIVSMTNSPFSSIALNVLFAMMIGLFFAELRNVRKAESLQ